MAELAKYTFNQWFDDSGDPLNAGTVTVYDAGTVNLSTIYSDKTGTALANPFTLDSSGRVQTGDLFLGPGDYDLVLEDSDGNEIDTQDDANSTILDASFTVSNGVVFGDGSRLLQNSEFVFNSTNTRIGLGTAIPTAMGSASSDENSLSLGEGYINFARDSTASSRNIQFYKNGSLHSGIVTDTGGFKIIGSDGNTDVTIDTSGNMDVDGNVSAGGTLTVDSTSTLTGLATFSSGITLSATTNLTIAGDCGITYGGVSIVNGVLTLDDGANWRITMTFNGGFLTAVTTAASSAALADWAAA